MLLEPQRRILFAFLLATNFVYFASSAYITCSNDGSHFALVSALVEQGTVKINDFMQYAMMFDYAYKDGEYYSDRTPGTAFLSVPFYAFGKLLRETGLGSYLSSHQNICEVFVIFLPNIAGTLVVLLMFKLCQFFRFDFKTSLISSFIFAFATLSWFESTRLFSHAVSMAAVLGTVYLVVVMKKFDSSHRGHIIGISALLSLASIIEIQNILLVPAFLLYLLLSRKVNIKDILKEEVRVPLLLAMVLFISIYSSLLVYNYVAFDELTIKSNMYNPRFPEERSFFTSLSGDFHVGLDRLFTNLLNSEVIFDWSKGVCNDAPGLLVTSPILVLSLMGFYYLFKSDRDEAVLFLVLILTEVVVVAFHTTVLTRHISTILPYLFFPLGFVIEKSFKHMKAAGASRIRRHSLFLLVSVLSLISAARVFYVMNMFWRRSLSSPFMFVQEIPSYVFFYGSLSIVYLVLKTLSTRIRLRS